ncbi:hypothetical protein [Halopiger goleimassiliensis]|uniref:hypothetical protein n=1 Tax=Halopiger goleimassiliensis TaxID=1293048 RepID=UPI0009DB7B91|nr:hypothetical protein [Halopiger goleimassiliensis]
MTDLSRRTLLCGAAGLAAVSAGCLDEGSDPATGGNTGDGTETSGDDTDGDAGNETDGSDDGGESDESDAEDGDDESDGSAEGETDADQASLESTGFSHPNVPTEPDVELIDDADQASEWVEQRNLDETAEFVDETDFEEQVLVALEADAPNLCHTMSLEGLSFEDDELEVRAAVHDESTPDEACAQAETTVGQLVRVPTTELTVSATITDRDGRTRGISIASARDSESDTGIESDGGDE